MPHLHSDGWEKQAALLYCLLCAFMKGADLCLPLLEACFPLLALSSFLTSSCWAYLEVLLSGKEILVTVAWVCLLRVL